MIDVGRFMQDGVGVKGVKYEQTLLGGAGTFTANGKIVCAAGSSYNSSSYVTYGGVALIPSISTGGVVFQSISADSMGTHIGYVDEKTITYGNQFSNTTNGFIVLSEKE